MNYLSRRYYAMLGTTLFGGFGLACYNASLNRAEERIKSEQGQHFRSEQDDNNILTLEKMIANAKTKDFQEKIETCYDAAVRTHNIGFPSSISQKSNKVGENSSS